MQWLLEAVDGVSGTRGLCQLQFFVVHIDADRACAAETRSSHRTQPHSATTENCDGVIPGKSSTCRRVKSHGQRLNQAQFFWSESGRIQLVSRHDDEFAERTVSLDAKSLVELTSIRTPSPARCAFAAAGVRAECDIHSGGEFAVAAVAQHNPR